jgi:hypothetical protein
MSHLGEGRGGEQTPPGFFLESDICTLFRCVLPMQRMGMCVLVYIPNNKGAKVSARFFVQLFLRRICPPTKPHNTAHLPPYRFVCVVLPSRKDLKKEACRTEPCVAGTHIWHPATSILHGPSRAMVGANSIQPSQSAVVPNSAPAAAVPLQFAGYGNMAASPHRVIGGAEGCRIQEMGGGWSRRRCRGSLRLG